MTEKNAAALGLLTRGCLECHTMEDLRSKIASGKPLRVKLGVDPTFAALHLGHTVILSRLRAFQDQGHTAVLIIGDFTARIGDPSGRDTTRPPLSLEDIKANAATYRDQAFRVLDPGRTEIRFNSEWLEPFVQKDLLSVLRRTTVGQLMQREDFSARARAALPITLLEILYPLFQGYESVAVRADVELGGSDQLFNLLMGRALQKDYGQEPQVAMTLPLLVGLDGSKKMSKSYGNTISLTEGARELFGKIMSLSDELMLSYCELLTQRDMAQVRKTHPLEAKKALAAELTARFHGGPAGSGELQFFEDTFSKNKRPENIPERKISEEVSSWSQLLVKLELVGSRKEAQRLIAQGAFKVDGEVVRRDPIAGSLGTGGGRAIVLQVGRHKFCKVTAMTAKESSR
ncbi:MAG: tyrosine--tRNA ligase [Elusimicrobia bacterium]|nr:tyrosine--tRNA ligase [Elusimicrobiota bacterium]